MEKDPETSRPGRTSCDRLSHVTDLSGCRGGAKHSFGKARRGRFHTPTVGSVEAAWFRSAAEPPSSRNAAGSPSSPSPPPVRRWTPDGHSLLCPGPECHQLGTAVRGRTAACWCRGKRQPEVWARRARASRRCCPEMFAGRSWTARRCRSLETDCWTGGTSSAATSDWTSKEEDRFDGGSTGHLKAPR